MAKKSKIARDSQRREVVAQYAERRRELKRLSINPHVSESERESAMAALHRLPRNASPTVCAVGMLWTDVRGATSGSSVCLGSGSGRWPIGASCPGSPSRAGENFFLDDLTSGGARSVYLM